MRLERLRHVAEIRVSNVDKKAVEGDVPVRLCNYTDVYYNERITANLDFMDATATPDQLIAFHLARGDVLVTKDSETPDDIGAAAVVVSSAPDVVCGYHLALVRPKGDRLDGRYLRYALASGPARGQMSSFANGITRFGLRATSIGNVVIPMRAIDEQRAIADYLDRETVRLDTLIEKKRRLLSLLGDRFQSAVYELLNGGWPMVALRRAWELIDCKHVTPDYVPEGIPVVSPGDISPGRLSITRCTRFVSRVDLAMLTEGGRRPRKGDIVYGRNATVGVASYVDTDEPFCLGQDVCLIRSRDNDQRFLAAYLNWAATDQLAAKAVGSTFTRINVADILGLIVPLPPRQSHLAIGDRIDALESEADALRHRTAQQVERLREKRAALITAAVAGQIPVPGAA